MVAGTATLLGGSAMGLRGWGNGLTAAGLILAVGVAVAQAPEGNTRYLVALGITVVSAIVAIALLRPKADEETARRLNYLRPQRAPATSLFCVSPHRQ